ncbi:MAG: PTS sugar transporter subunit IIA [Calditrichaeota bacterium]|nr:MAG: PTS sugar transporter subunit IIA [Calditrichota bacterium]
MIKEAILLMKLKEILSEDRIKIPLESEEKKKIIEELVDLVVQSKNLQDKKDNILKAVLEREAVMSTGVGDEVAIPHGKADGLDDIVAALGVTKKPVDFQSLDGKPVRLVWLLVGPQDKTGPHLKALSRISRLMHKKDFKDKLLQINSPKEMIEAITAEEEKFF